MRAFPWAPQLDRFLDVLELDPTAPSAVGVLYDIVLGIPGPLRPKPLDGRTVPERHAWSKGVSLPEVNRIWPGAAGISAVNTVSALQSSPPSAQTEPWAFTVFALSHPTPA